MILKIFDYIQKHKIEKFLPAFLVGLSIITSMVNYFSFTSLFSLEKINNILFIMLVCFNVILIALLLIYIIYQLFNFFKFHHRNKFIFHFKIKILLIVTAICMISILFLILFSLSFFKLNSQILLGNIVDQSFNKSLQLSELYIDEQKQEIINDINNIKYFAEKNAKMLITSTIRV